MREVGRYSKGDTLHRIHRHIKRHFLLFVVMQSLKETVWTFQMQHIMNVLLLDLQFLPQSAQSTSESLIYIPVILSSEMSAQLSRISHTLSFVFPGRPDELIGQLVIKLHINSFPSSELQVKVGTQEIPCFHFLY